VTKLNADTDSCICVTTLLHGSTQKSFKKKVEQSLFILSKCWICFSHLHGMVL